MIEANSDRVAIAVPDPETGELGLIRYKRLTPEDDKNIAEYTERKQAALGAFEDRIVDHQSRMQEMDLEGDESWLEHENTGKEEDSG